MSFRTKGEIPAYTLWGINAGMTALRLLRPARAGSGTRAQGPK